MHRSRPTKVGGAEVSAAGVGSLGDWRKSQRQEMEIANPAMLPTNWLARGSWWDRWHESPWIEPKNRNMRKRLILLANQASAKRHLVQRHLVQRPFACKPVSANANGRFGLERSVPLISTQSSYRARWQQTRSKVTGDHLREFDRLGTRRHKTETP
jgi:hypothetical protein